MGPAPDNPRATLPSLSQSDLLHAALDIQGTGRVTLEQLTQVCVLLGCVCLCVGEGAVTCVDRPASPQRA